MQSIQFKRTGEAGKVPTPETLQVGEIAIQLADHVIFTKDKEHKVVQISVSPETHAELESKVDAHKQELDQTIALNDQTINAKVDEIKTATDATITANHEEINTKVDTIKRETDATIEANKNTAASELAEVNDALTATIAANKDAAAVATEELDTRINKKVDDIKTRTDETIAANDSAIHEKVDLIKAETDRTIETNKEHAQNQLEETFNHLTGVIAENKEIAAEAVTALSSTVEQKDTAIHKKVDNNKEFADTEIARLDSRIDNIDGSSDGKFIKIHHGTFNDAFLMSKTANYSDDPAVNGNANYMDYFGAYRVNGLDNWGENTGLILNVPHSTGKGHARGFEFQYGSYGNQVRTYGFDADGVKAYSHRMYHEGDKPTPAELNVYSKDEINKLFQKTLWMGPYAGWFKIASFTMGQNWGKSISIRLYGGNGYNVGQTGQTNILEVVIRNSNDNPKGLNLTVFQHMAAYDQDFCVVNTSDDNYELWGQYYEHSMYVMAQYQNSTDVSLVVHDNPEEAGRLDAKPTGDNVTNAVMVNMFNSFRNKGTLSFQGNSRGVYDINQLSEDGSEGRNNLRQFRSHLGAAIWHETVENGHYRLFSGNGHDFSEFEILASGTNRGGYVTAGRFVSDAGNDAFKIRYIPATESAMYQIYDRNTGDLNGYFGYGGANASSINVYNRLGDIDLTSNGSINIKGVTNHYGNINFHTSGANVSTHTFNLGIWGNSGSGQNRSAVFEVSDGEVWHFYSQRLTDGSREFAVSGNFVASQNINAQGDIKCNGGEGITIDRASGNRHIWFRESGMEKAVIWVEDSSVLKIRHNHGGQRTHAIHNGMIHMEGGQIGGSDKGLIRGAVGGGAFVDWRERPAGLLVDCQDSWNQAYNIWKATHWGQFHIASMDVHAGGGNSVAILHVGGGEFNFNHIGDFTASASVYCNDVYIRSDARLKINVEDYTENATDLVNTLKVKTYDKVKSLSDREILGREVGIIAQDLQKVLPEAVNTSSVGNADNPEEILTISNSAVNALLIKAVQEMSKRIEYLESKLK
ncbi:tail fiber domain-containing protein [Salmonella enterica subsp. enterica serovar Livingstone]|nr:tail fiber domain-containing protein [Salmonella enterica subsp. enterica serovar Livingstone]